MEKVVRYYEDPNRFFALDLQSGCKPTEIELQENVFILYALLREGWPGRVAFQANGSQTMSKLCCFVCSQTIELNFCQLILKNMEAKFVFDSLFPCNGKVTLYGTVGPCHMPYKCFDIARADRINAIYKYEGHTLMPKKKKNGIEEE